MRTGLAAAGLLLLLAAAPFAAGVPPGPGGLRVGAVSTLAKVRPRDAPPAATEAVSIAAARNEFEAVQLVLRTDATPLRQVDVEVGDFVAERGGHRIAAANVTVYRVAYVDLAMPSSAEGAAGEWPDPLLPRRDAYVGERRSAFPFDLAAGRNQPVWLEVYVPPKTPPGRYRAEIRLSIAGEPGARVAWNLRVRDFALPSTSTLPNTFGFSGGSALRGHRGRYTDDDELLRLTRLYSIAALRHRLSLHGGSQIPPPATFAAGRAEIDWSDYDREVAPFLDGTIFGSGEPLAGARFTSIDVRTPAGLDDERTVLYWRAWTERFRARGWLERLFLYVWDEPVESDYPQVQARGRLARRADPALPILLTEPWTRDLDGVVDLWAPLINCLDERRDYWNPCGAAAAGVSYAAARASGDRLWWYQSCASHGCNRVGEPGLEGWPSYAIDASAAAARVQPWLTFLQDVEGELYYNTVEAFASGPDPWIDPQRHGGNGDGTLFYPGTPARIGGTTHVPVESLRLKLIRDGLEDYEYLSRLADLAGAAWVKGRARPIALPRGERRPLGEALERAREEIATEIERRARGGATAAPEAGS